MRFDEQRSIYRDCQWCRGSGCIYCAGEAKKAYQAEFPDGPQLLGSFDLSTPEGVEAAKGAIGPDAIRKAFGPGGGGVEEIAANIAKAKSA